MESSQYPHRMLIQLSNAHSNEWSKETQINSITSLIKCIYLSPMEPSLQVNILYQCVLNKFFVIVYVCMFYEILHKYFRKKKWSKESIWYINTPKCFDKPLNNLGSMVKIILPHCQGKSPVNSLNNYSSENLKRLIWMYRIVVIVAHKTRVKIVYFIKILIDNFRCKNKTANT